MTLFYFGLACFICFLGGFRAGMLHIRKQNRNARGGMLYSHDRA